MATDIPMNTLEHVVYKGTELNAFDIADCRWRKPYNITIPTNITGIAKVTVTRVSVSNCGQLNDTTSITATGSVLYEDTLSAAATAATGYHSPTASLTGNISNNKVTGDVGVTASATAGYYTVSLGAIPNATAYVSTTNSNYSSSVTAQYGSTIYIQIKPNNCYVYTLNGTHYTPSSPYTISYALNSTNFTLSSTTPATSPTASNKPTATKSIGGSTKAAYYKVTLSVTNGTVIDGATTTIQYGNSITYKAKGNSKYYYVNKTTGGYGDSGYSTTYTPSSSILPADGGAVAATAVACSYTVGSCTAYKTYTIKTTKTTCNGNTYVKSAHALGETSFTSKSTSDSSYTVYETDSFYSYCYAYNMGGYKITAHTCKNNGVTVSPSSYQYLTVTGSGSNTSWTTTTSSTASTGIKYRANIGTSSSPKTVNGNVVISYTGAELTYTYYGYNSNIYSTQINSGTTYVNIYDSSKVSTAPPRLAYYPASAIRINGCICLQKDGTNSGFSDHPLTTTKTANLTYLSISGSASMGNQGPASGNSGAAQRQYLSVSNKAGAYKFYIRIWGISIPS